MASEDKEREAKKKWWKEKLKDYPTVVDYFLWEARKKKGIFGEVVISPALIDQIVTLNPVCLEGQAEIIYNVFIYRVFKWHWWAEKVDEIITLTPTPPPAFAPLMAQKERLEATIKQGLASAMQAVADYELLKHDERKYKEILDYFRMGEKDEHVLRALYVDRVDAYMGEGYSMISMAKRWPTIIGDFLKMKSEWKDVETIRKNLHVTTAEANVLKTKNELFKEWKKLFFPDVRERYARIKNLVESRKRSVDEYREWLKPYLSKLKMIREAAEIEDAAAGLTDVTKFSFTPQGEVRAKLWFWKGVKPEEVGQPLIISGWGEVPYYDDWVKEHIIALEAKYDVDLTEKEILGILDAFRKGGHSLAGKRTDVFAVYPAPRLDDRFLYYSFIDLDYVCQYKKGSTGPMVVEDQYWHFHPFLLSKNFMFFALLELEYKKKRFAKEIEKLIGVTTEEEKILEEVKKEYPESGEKIEGKKKESFKQKWSKIKLSLSNKKKKFKKSVRPLLRFFVKPGPYEINVGERISKTYGLYFGAEIAGLRDLIKETAYRLSGQRP
jgi:hypothetical protein